METYINFLTKWSAYKPFVYFCLMQFLTRIFDFYLRASVHVALAVFSLLYVGFQSLNISLDVPLTITVFCGTIMSYNFIKYGESATYYFRVTKKAFVPIQILSVLAGFFGAYGLFELSNFSYGVLILMIFLTGLYALPMLPSKKNLRSIGGLKMSVVALVWAMASVLLPLSTLGKELFSVAVVAEFFWVGVMGLFLAHFILVWVLMIPFEIRDFKTDPEEVKNIVQKYGLRKTIYFGVLGSFLFILLQLFNAAVFKWSTLEIALQFLLGILLIVSLFMSFTPRSKYFANFWVESIPIGYALSWFLIS